MADKTSGPPRAAAPGTPDLPARRNDAAPSADLLGGLLGSPILWGAVVTVGFYAALPHLPVQRELMVRYFCSHPLEYATTGLFFVGIALLLTKGLRSLSENAAFRRVGWALPTANPASGDTGSNGVSVGTAHPTAVTTCKNVAQRIAALPADVRRSWLATRIADVCSYVRSRRSTAGLEEHLKYLAEVAADRLHASYALVRTITWAVPILGFLGTVIGITIAIANVTPEQLDTSLSDVTGGLAVAFDTTALALALSLLLVFASFVVERAEQNVQARVEDFGVRELMSLFPQSEEAPASPLADAERRAAEQLLQRTESLVEQQVRAWDDSLEAMRSRWHDTLDNQQSQLDRALIAGLAGTLAEHDHRLRETRQQFVAAFEQASECLTEGLLESRLASQSLQETFAAKVDALASRVTAQLSDLGERQATRVDGLAEAIADRLGTWLTRLEEANDGAAEQREALHEQGTVLLRVVEQEENLARLQLRLNENLETVRAAETFEQALHELTAAVHLLTARAKPRAA
jgi:biopolymer transport protein ExbB/TolQ